MSEAHAFVTFTPPSEALGAEGLSGDAHPDVVYDGEGGWAMVFLRTNDVYFAKTTDGSTWTTPVLVTSGGDVLADPVLARESGGAWIAAWNRTGFTFAGTIEYARSTDGGATWAGGVLAGPATSDRIHIPAIAADDAGNVVIAYASADDPIMGSGVDFDIKFVRSGDGGSTWSSPSLLDLDGAFDDPRDLFFTDNAEFSPFITVAANGEWLAAWVDTEPHPDHFVLNARIKGARSVDGGATWSAPSAWSEPIAVGPGHAVIVHRLLRVRAGENGTVILVWQRDPDVWYARSTDFGLTWSAEATLGPMVRDGLASRPVAIDSDGAGHWIVVWWSRQTGDVPYGTDYDLFFSRSDDDGLIWSPPEPATLDAEKIVLNSKNEGVERPDLNPTLASDGSGQWLLTWMQFVDGSRVFAARSQCWACTGDPLACVPDDGAPCDDGDVCSISSSCSSGECLGTDYVEARAACRWAVLGGTDSEQGRLKLNSRVVGNVCGGTGRLGNVSIAGHLVATSSVGSKGLAVKGFDVNLRKHVVTGGTGIQQRGLVATLPGTSRNEIATGTIVSKYPQGVYDTTGAHLLVSQCLLDKSGIAPLSAMLDSFVASESLGSLTVPTGQATTLTAPSPGALNVFDVDRLSIGRDATLTLDGGSDPATVVIVRINDKAKLANRATIALAGELTPERTLFYVRGSRFLTSRGEATGAGAIIAAAAKIKLGGTTVWTGAIATGGSLVSLGESTVVAHAPFIGF